MSESNGNFLTKIKDKINSDKEAYIKIKLEISKIFFIFTCSVYFLSYLCIIAGFQKEIMGKVLIGIFPLFVFGICALIYDLLIYIIEIYTGKAKFAKLPLIIFLTLIFAFILALNYGLKI